MDKIINRGDRTPFNGVLVPEDVYRFYRSEVQRAARLDVELINKDITISEKNKIPSTVLVFVVSFVSGIAAYSIIQGNK